MIFFLIFYDFPIFLPIIVKNYQNRTILAKCVIIQRVITYIFIFSSKYTLKSDKNLFLV